MQRFFAYVALGVAAAAIGAVAVWRIAFCERPLRVDEILAAYREDGQYAELTITNPLDQTLFPPEIVPPTLCWEDESDASDAWLVLTEFADSGAPMHFLTRALQWTPEDKDWQAIKRRSLAKSANVTIVGVNHAAPEKILSRGRVSFGTCKDEVAAPIFYREVNLPFQDAVKDPSRIRWRFGAVSSKKQPPIVLQGLPVCGNCHSFSADGSVMGMDVDYANDKGSYAIAPVAKDMPLDSDHIITWNDYKSEDGEYTFGLLSQISPDGRYVISTVKDRSVFVPRDSLPFSQLFFPIKGILAVYDCESKQFFALPGADDKEFVQSNPTWSPDGKHIVFARSRAYHLANVRDDRKVLLGEEDCREFLDDGKTFLFDLYRIPFNEGRGGKAEPLPGASHNGMSNYFAKYSPDGKWIVFCKARTFMLLQPDSELYIIPAAGGEARRLRCNMPRMNSWHSWSPNGKWLVFSSKANSAYTQLFLTHIDDHGRSTPPVLLSWFTAPKRAANIPEFIAAAPDAIKRIREQFVDDVSFYRAGTALMRKGECQQAIEPFQKALEINPENVEVRNNLGNCLIRLGRLDEAEAHFHTILKLEPDNKMAHTNLGAVLSLQGNHAEAIRHCREALRIDPECFDAHLNLGRCLFDDSQVQEATRSFSEAVRLIPNHPVARYQLGLALRKEGKDGQAVVHYARAIEEQPDMLPPLLDLAWLRAASRHEEVRDGQEAVRLGTKACELTQYQDPAALDILAAAYAAVGRFPEAIRYGEVAVGIARTTGNENLANVILRRLELYTRRKPLVSPGAP